MLHPQLKRTTLAALILLSLSCTWRVTHFPPPVFHEHQPPGFWVQGKNEAWLGSWELAPARAAPPARRTLGARTSASATPQPGQGGPTPGLPVGKDMGVSGAFPQDHREQGRTALQLCKMDLTHGFFSFFFF